MSHTFDGGHLLAASLVVEGELAGDGLLHLHQVGQEEDDLSVVIGQVASAADALSPLDVGPTQQGHRGPLVHVLRGQSGGRGRKTDWS